MLALRRTADRAGMLVLLAAVTAAGLAGARGAALAFHGGAGGLVSTGGVVAGVVAAWIVARACRRPLLPALDAIAPAFVLALAAGRVGCFLAGCCWGRPTRLPDRKSV